MHATGMVGTFPFLHLGLPQVMLPRFNAAAAIVAIRRHQVTTTFVVPGMLTRIADQLERAGAADSAERSLPSLRRVLYGGAGRARRLAAADRRVRTRALPALRSV
jgi:acyl-CoA synthetase (AMP-forming)/AMP-acid ligase II